MFTNKITAVFDRQDQAQATVDELRRIGVLDAHLSFVSRHSDVPLGGGGGMAVADRDELKHDTSDAANRFAKGALGGAAVGALFGLAAAVIPGVGPFIAAGAIASALGATGGLIASGAIVGATSGAIAGALTKAGWDEHEAGWLGTEIEQGATMVTVVLDQPVVPRSVVEDVLRRHGGRMHTIA